MTTAQLRSHIKKSVDGIPAQRLAALAEYVAFLCRPSLPERLARGKSDIAAGKGTNWRRTRRDVSTARSSRMA